MQSKQYNMTRDFIDYNPGDIIKKEARDQIYIENGYTQEFRGETSLNVGRYGKLKKI